MSPLNLSEIINLMLSGLVGLSIGYISAWVHYWLVKKRDDMTLQHTINSVLQDLDREQELMRSQEHGLQQAESRSNMLSQNLFYYAELLRHTGEQVIQLKDPCDPHTKEIHVQDKAEFQNRIELLEQTSRDLMDSRARIIQLLSEFHGKLAQIDSATPSMELDIQRPELQRHLANALEQSSRLLHEV